MKTSYLFIIFIFILSPSICAADDIIQGQYCYTYGDNESLKEAKELTHTLAIRNAIESYRTFAISSSNVKDFALTNDIIQIISSGYMKNIRTIDSKVEGRTVCEKIQGTVQPQIIADVIRMVQKRRESVEQKGIDSNGALKILRAETEIIHYPTTDYTTAYDTGKVHVTFQALQNIGPKTSDISKFAICIDVFDEDGNPVGYLSRCNYVHSKIKNQYGTETFYILQKQTFRIWVPQE